MKELQIHKNSIIPHKLIKAFNKIHNIKLYTHKVDIYTIVESIFESIKTCENLEEFNKSIATLGLNNTIIPILEELYYTKTEWLSQDLINNCMQHLKKSYEFEKNYDINTDKDSKSNFEVNYTDYYIDYSNNSWF